MSNAPQAEAPAHLRGPLTRNEPWALATLKPCRFCGGSDLLAFHETCGEWIAYDVDLIRFDEDGDAVGEMYDAVECTSCCAMPPYAVWQSDGDVFSGAQRAAYAAYAEREGIVSPGVADPLHVQAADPLGEHLRLARAH